MERLVIETFKATLLDGLDEPVGSVAIPEDDQDLAEKLIEKKYGKLKPDFIVVVDTDQKEVTRQEYDINGMTNRILIIK